MKYTELKNKDAHASRPRIISLFVFAAMMISFSPAHTRAAWGDFDTSFGFQGATVDPITGYTPRSVAIQPDGKILVTGYRITLHGRKGFFLRRYLSDGQLDTAFGTNGAAIGPETNTFTSDYRGETIVVFPQGKIAVSGWANGYHAVWQFSSTGIKDKTFGANGLLSLTGYPVVVNEYAEMNLQSGKLLLSVRKHAGGDDRIVLVRLTSTGDLDVTFGNTGESQTNMTGTKGSGTVVEPDGKITVFGVKLTDSFAKGLERKLANGQTDSTFNPPTANAYGITLPGLVKMSNAKYAVRWGNLAGNGSVSYYLQRFGPTGFLETTVTPYNGFSSTNCPEIFTNQNDGKVVVNFGGLLFRTTPDFNVFESNYCSNLNGISLTARAAIQSDDKMVAAGVYNNYVILARLLPN
jgi:uncharacterized delta-60 repeat protein